MADAAWSAPGSAADPDVLRALGALRLRPESVLLGQGVDSRRWLLDALHAAIYDGASSADPALTARLAALDQNPYMRQKVPPANVERLVAGRARAPSEELRLTGLAVDADGDRVASFESLDGRPAAVAAPYVWLVGRLFGGWDAATQAGPREPVIFWRGATLVAFVMPLDDRRADAAPLRWLAGAAPVPPAFTAEYDGPLPPVPDGVEFADGAARAAGVDAYLRELASAAGGIHGGRGWIVPTRVGIVRFVVEASAAKRSWDWWLYWRFDEPEVARTALSDVEAFDVGLSGKWNVVSYLGIVLRSARQRLARFQLPPALRPAPWLLRVIEMDYSRFSRYRPAWRGGRWRVARTDGRFELLRGAWAAREPAAWRAMQLDLSAAMRHELEAPHA